MLNVYFKTLHLESNVKPYRFTDDTSVVELNVKLKLYNGRAALGQE